MSCKDTLHVSVMFPLLVWLNYFRENHIPFPSTPHNDIGFARKMATKTGLDGT